MHLWAAGFTAAGLVQGLFPRRFGHGTSWGYNAGWQREIAFYRHRLAWIGWPASIITGLAIAVTGAADLLRRRGRPPGRVCPDWT